MTDSPPAEGPREESGRFRDADRSVVTTAALPLLATYVADAPTWGLSASDRVATAAQTADLAGFVEMRVALAAARRLDNVLRAMMDRASFHYSRIAEESVGAVRGQLDIERYIRQRSTSQAPRRYPVRVLRRRYATPENTLGMYAALWVLRALARAPLHLLPAGAPERFELVERRSGLMTLIRQPILAGAQGAAEEVWRRQGLNRLVDEVEGRLEGGRIAAADRYRDLVEWTKEFNPESLAAPGVVEWLFYDARFDSKLFEIWILSLLLEGLTRRLGSPTVGPRPLYERAQHAVAVWKLGAATIRLYFQASLTRLGAGEPRWSYVKPDEAPLRGFPDVSITIEGVGGHRRIVLIDPKLRERAGPPTEEIYKMLGYFANLGASESASGVLVFYAPDSARTYELAETGGGRLLVIGMDPSDTDGAEEGVAALIDVLLDLAHLSPEAVAAFVAAQPEGGAKAAQEATTAVVQHQAVQAMASGAAALPASTLEPVRKATAAQLHEIWESLSADVQVMLVTAEYFGINAPSDADHSGPLLGLAAACERLLYEGFFDFLGSRHPALFPSSLTFGTLIYHLNDAFRPHPRSDEGRAILAALPDLHQVDVALLRDLVGELRDLNVRYRIPAAHRDVVAQDVWVGGRARILEVPNGILVKLARALFSSD